MGHMINRQSHAFSCNSGNNCTRNRLNCTRLRLVQLAVACAIMHSKACDYLYKFSGKLIFVEGTYHLMKIRIPTNNNNTMSNTVDTQYCNAGHFHWYSNFRRWCLL